jgi:hypothetical protein
VKLVSSFSWIPSLCRLKQPADRGRETRNSGVLRRNPIRRTRWATREHGWIDRAASAWLIRRFIDPDAPISLAEASEGLSEARGWF